MRKTFAFIPLVAALAMPQADSVYAETVQARYQITTPWVTDPSIAGASLMGAQAYGNYNPPGADPVGALLARCQLRTVAGSNWPKDCDPSGMAAAMSEVAGQSWILNVYPYAEAYKAFNKVFEAIKGPKSGAVVPLWGQADRWITAYEIEADLIGSNYIIRRLDGVMGFPAGMAMGGALIGPGILRFAASSFVGQYYQVIAAPPGARHFDHYLVSWDPPPGYRSLLPDRPMTWAKPAGIVKSNEAMTAEVATERVFDALRRAAFDHTADVKQLLTTGTPSTALHVNGTRPDGSAWPYFLVPIRDQEDRLMAMAQLSAHDGSVETLLSLPNPVPYDVLSPGSILQLARDQLRQGETLGTPSLAWDPRLGREPGTPHFPTYHVPILDARGRKLGKVLLMAHTGQVVGRAE